MLNCKQASELLSQGMDEKLSLGKRLSLRMHLLMCHGCSNFISQLRFLRKIVQHHRDYPQCDNFHLSDGARQRIYHAMEEARRVNEQGDQS
jgi:hypothetical protein